MNKHEIVKGIEIINAQSSGLKQLINDAKQTSTINLVEVSGRIILEVVYDQDRNDDLINFIETHAFDLGLDYTQIQFVYLDTKNGQIISESQMALKFKLDQELEEDEELPISMLPDLVEFIQGNSAIADEEIEELSDNQADNNQHENNFEKAVGEQSGFEDDVSFEEEPKENNQNETSYSQGYIEQQEDFEPEEETEILEEVKNLYESDQWSDEQVTEELIDSNEDMKDPLYIKAIQLFDNSEKSELPIFKGLVLKELQPELIRVGFDVAKAKTIAVLNIYQMLKKNEEKALEMAEEVLLKKAKQSHEEAIDVIQRNLKTEIEKTKDEHHTRYESAKERYVQAQLPLLREKYDAENLDTFRETVKTKIAELQDRSEEKITDENGRFEEYVESTIKNSKNEATENIDVSEEINQYNQAVSQQVERLAERAKEFENQVKQATSELRDENGNLKSKLKDTQSKLDIQQSTEKQRIESEISVQVNSEVKKEQNKHKQEVDELVNRLKSLEDDLAREKHNVDALTKKLTSNEYTGNVTPQNMQYPFQAMPVQATPVAPNNKNSASLFSIILPSLLILCVILGVFGGMWISGRNNAQASEGTGNSVNVLSQDNSVESYDGSETSTSGVKVGDTFPYTTENGEDVLVEVDGDNFGHYIDKEGEKHTVVFK